VLDMGQTLPLTVRDAMFAVKQVFRQLVAAGPVAAVGVLL